MPAAAVDDAEALVAQIKADARANWRGWAEAMSEGADAPPIIEVLAAAAVLRISEPMGALAADAHAVRDVRDLEIRAAKHRARITSAMDRYGGAEGVRERIRILEAELRTLRNMTGPLAFSQVGALSGQATNLRRLHPRAFAPDTNMRTPAPAKPARRRAAS